MSIRLRFNEKFSKRSNEEMHRALIIHDPVFYYITTVLLMRTDTALLRLA